MAQNRLSWNEVASSFHIATAASVLSLNSMTRHQEVREKLPWLGKDGRPFALLFISHRWETLEHPDPTGRQLAAIHAFLRCVIRSVEAMLVLRQDRLVLVPSLTKEGVLQAEEIARRMLGFGPFSNSAASIDGADRRTIIKDYFDSCGSDRERFRAWLSDRIGVWLDYTCMPQVPLSREEEIEFRRTLDTLDLLAASSDLVSLRNQDDDFSTRGWCLLESFLASGLSFSKGVYLNVDKMEKTEDVSVPSPPVPKVANAYVAEVLTQGYEQDLAAFRDACEYWLHVEGPLVESWPPDPWTNYRSLQGSAFPDAGSDPNPYRPALELVRSLEVALIDRWLMSPDAHVFDLGKAVGLLMRHHRIRCADSTELRLGFLFALNGWIDAFRPMFRECLRQLSADANLAAAASPAASPMLAVKLSPLDAATRNQFGRASPNSAESWRSRLAKSQTRSAESAVNELREALEQQSLMFEFLPLGHALEPEQIIEDLIG
ncbi:MAG: hypothetical protein IH606_00760 [Burkholderiales bacterium]|nr:hypothetical protein [Burkholderiales bacterium]